jgi:hypothetical protein
VPEHIANCQIPEQRRKPKKERARLDKAHRSKRTYKILYFSICMR